MFRKHDDGRIPELQGAYFQLHDRLAALYDHLDLEYVPERREYHPAFARKRERPVERPVEFTDERPKGGRPPGSKNKPKEDK